MEEQNQEMAIAKLDGASPEIMRGELTALIQIAAVQQFGRTSGIVD